MLDFSLLGRIRISVTPQTFFHLFDLCLIMTYIISNFRISGEVLYLF